MISENDLIELGFSKNLMAGTGWNSISSMTDAIYYYSKGRVSINTTEFWTWFLDGKMRNDIAVNTIEELTELIKRYK